MGYDPPTGVYGLEDGWPKLVSCRKSLKEWAKHLKLGHTRPPHSTSPTSPPHGAVPLPQTHDGEPHLWVRTHRRTHLALGTGGQNGSL
jgi:hypothetical protein